MAIHYWCGYIVRISLKPVLINLKFCFIELLLKFSQKFRNKLGVMPKYHPWGKTHFWACVLDLSVPSPLVALTTKKGGSQSASWGEGGKEVPIQITWPVFYISLPTVSDIRRWLLCPAWIERQTLNLQFFVLNNLAIEPTQELVSRIAKASLCLNITDDIELASSLANVSRHGWREDRKSVV